MPVRKVHIARSGASSGPGKHGLQVECSQDSDDAESWEMSDFHMDMA